METTGCVPPPGVVICAGQCQCGERKVLRKPAELGSRWDCDSLLGAETVNIVIFLFVQPTLLTLPTTHTIMCGIFAYLNFLTPKSRKEILELLIRGLQRLEYRGYDSAGVGVDGPTGNSSISVSVSCY